MSDALIPEPHNRPSSRLGGPLRWLYSVLTPMIAVAAIGLAVWEGIENRRHNRLSVQPRLDGGIEAGRDGNGEYMRIAVESSGLGPAVIDAFRVYFDGEIQDSSSTASGRRWEKVTDVMSAEGVQIHARAFGSGHYFPAGREYVLFEARRQGAPSSDGVTLVVLPRVTSLDGVSEGAMRSHAYPRAASERWMPTHRIGRAMGLVSGARGRGRMWLWRCADA